MFHYKGRTLIVYCISRPKFEFLFGLTYRENWLDGTALSGYAHFKNFGDADGRRHCFYMRKQDDGWDETQCDDVLPYICETAGLKKSIR